MKKNNLYQFVVITLCMLVIGGCAKKEITEPAVMYAIDDNNFNRLVYNQSGPVLVYFSDQYEHQNDMKNQFQRLFNEYRERAVYGHVSRDNVARIQNYNVTSLPTLNYYFNGVLVDQIVGYPSDRADKAYWPKDIEIWMRETVLQGPDADRQFSYLFNGGYELQFQPY